MLVAAVKTGIPQVPGPAETPNPSIPSLLPGSPIYRPRRARSDCASRPLTCQIPALTLMQTYGIVTFEARNRSDQMSEFLTY